MADRNFSEIIPRVNESAPGCPYPVVLSHVRNSAIKACERTLAYRYQIPLYNLQAGVHEYAYNVPTNAQVQHVFEVEMNGAPLKLLNMQDAIRKYPEWADLYSGESASELWSETQSGAIGAEEYNQGTFNSAHDFVVPDSIVAAASTPCTITQINPHRYIVLPLPDDADTYEIRMFVALKPKRTATAMQEDALNDLEDLIVHGALQTLLVMPNVPWMDRDLAAYHAKQFTYNAAERRARANLGLMGGSLRVENVKFA